MKLYCLSGNPNRPCFILKFKQTTIMLDCGLDTSCLLHFLPTPLVPGGKFSKLNGFIAKDSSLGSKLQNELKECSGQVFVDSAPEFFVPQANLVDMSEVDIIVISNYHCMLALPFITEYTTFKGTVYVTDPTLHLGRQLMQEMVEYIESSPHSSDAVVWKSLLGSLPSPLKEAVSAPVWKQCYSAHDVQCCISKLTPVGFDQKLSVFGNLELTPVSSGFCLGSANWIIKSQHHKISYVSSSSTLTTHPKPISTHRLKDSNILILTALTQTPSYNPDKKIGEFCYNTEHTLRNGGNVLVPCYPTGVIYDLLECLSGHLDNRGLGMIPLYFISPVAPDSLAYSQIYSEWLSSGKQNKVYLPEHPFPHAELIKNNRLKFYSSMHDGFHSEMKTPCVVFTGHPSLRFGNVVHFLELWGNSTNNTVVFTEPDFPYLDAFAPYQPLAMKVSYCPIDTSLSFSQARKLLGELKPSCLVLSEQYTTPPPLLQHKPEFTIQYEPAPIVYQRGHVLTLPVKRKYEQVALHPTLAANLVPAEIRPGVAVSVVSGMLENNDCKYTLRPFAEGNTRESGPEKKFRRSTNKPPSYVFGSLDVHDFVSRLKSQGIHDAKLETGPEGHIVHLASDDTLIQIEKGTTHIICPGNEKLRVKIKDTLLKCLKKL